MGATGQIPVYLLATQAVHGGNVCSRECSGMLLSAEVGAGADGRCGYPGLVGGKVILCATGDTIWVRARVGG